jgi:signal transduction histidine kinase
MAVRRLFEFLQVIESERTIPDSMFNSWVAVFISLLVLLGVIFIRRIFNFQKRIDELRVKNESRVFSAIIKTEENERQKFAKELHDGLGPLLASIKMAVSSLLRSETKANKEIIANTDNLIDEAIISIKEISNNLSPHVLNNFGLLKAVKSFVDRLNLTGKLKIVVSSNLGNERYDYNTEVVLYRIICELVTNTLKHASATEVNIDLFTDNNRLIVDYYDNGIGFNTDSLSEISGLGFSNIQTRVKSLNGSLKVFSHPNEGVNINISI